MAQVSKTKKRIFIVILMLVLSAIFTFVLLSPEQRNGMFNAIGGEGANNEVEKELKAYISVKTVTSRQAAFGDDWIIKGKIFNTHDSLDVTEIKLMFNFSDGVETVTLNEKINAGNTVGRKFKERISGHGDAEFESVEVLEAK